MLLEVSTINALPISQKVALLEVVSNAIFEDSNNFDSPEWHQAVLSKRKRELNDEENWLSLDDVKAQLKG